MKEPATRLHKKFKIAGSLLILGLLVEAATLYWSHPTSFLGFIAVGGFLVAAGVALYLFSLVGE